MAVEAGTRVGRFVIHEYVGQGDLGLLFRARGPNSGSVAVKVLGSLSGARVRARFLVLARRLAGIRHPNLATVIDFGEHDEAPYLVLQFVPGGSLAELLRRSSISQPAALWVLRGIANGVDHAHESGLIHGALKPQQVVLNDLDHPLVTDFGLAPLRWPRPDGVSVVVPERNAAYAAPELLTGGQPTAAVDRYAFATIAYELLTGRAPFQGEPHDVMNAQLDAAPPAPGQLNPALTPEIGTVLLRGLAKDPRARWPTCIEMVEALAEAMGPARLLPLPAPAPTPRPARDATRPASPPQAAAGARGHVARWSLVLTGALVVIVLAVGGSVVVLRTMSPGAVVTLPSPTTHPGDTIVDAGPLAPPSAPTPAPSPPSPAPPSPAASPAVARVVGGASPVPTGAPTGSPASTPAPTQQATPSATPARTPTPTPKPTRSPSPSPSVTPSASPSSSPSPPAISPSPSNPRAWL